MAPRSSADRAAATIQRAVTDDDVKSGTVVTGKKPEDLKVKLRDKEFRVDDELGAMAMFEWAAAAELSIDDQAGLAAVHAMLQDVIHEDDWQEFRHYARVTRPKIKVDELIEVINGASELISGRPTEQPSG
jgi:hypothetical protein